MQDRPDAAELAQAVREFLETEVLSTVQDPRLRFRMLVAINGIGILERELAAGSAPMRREIAALTQLLGVAEAPDDADLRAQARSLNRELALRIRGGNAPEGTLAAVKAIVADKLRIASPRYLERFRE